MYSDLQDGRPGPNLHRSNKVPSFVPSEYYSGFLQPLTISSLTVWAQHTLGLLLQMPLEIFDKKNLWPLHLEWPLVLVLYISIGLFINVWSFDCTSATGSGKDGPSNLRLLLYLTVLSRSLIIVLSNVL